MKAKLIFLIVVFTAGVPRLAEAADLVPGMGYTKLKVQVVCPTYVVRKGDTLGEIAKKFTVTVTELLRVNSIKDAKSLRIGQKLLIPK